MKYIKSTVLGAILIGSGFLASPAAADIGDGNEACNPGEICLYDWANSARTKHYWWNANYGTVKWWNTVTNQHQERVKDDTGAVRNRDSGCDVKLIDVKFGIDGSQIIPNNNIVTNMNAGMNNKADKHERVNC